MFCYAEPSAWNALPDFVKDKTAHFLYLLLDASLNISTSHFTSTPSIFEVILQFTHYVNYLFRPIQPPRYVRQTSVFFSTQSPIDCSAAEESRLHGQWSAELDATLVTLMVCIQQTVLRLLPVSRRL